MNKGVDLIEGQLLFNCSKPLIKALIKGNKYEMGQQA